MNKESHTKKKLLVDAHTFDENHQGIRTFLKGIYSAIDFNPDDVEVILVANNIDNLKREFGHKTHFKFIKLQYKNKYLRLGFEVPQLIKSLKIDFAHFNYFLPLFLHKNCKYIVTIHDILFIDYPQFFPVKYRLINSFLFKRSAKKANLLTTVSEYSKQRIQHHFKITKPISILPNAVSDRYLENCDKQTDKSYIKNKFGIEKYIIFVSRLEPRKNHLTLLQAYKEMKLWNKGYSLVFIGKKTFDMKQLDLEIETVKKISAGKLYVLNNIANEDLAKFYNAAELSIFPSLCEGFGIPPLESATMKTPTLCSNATAMSDYDFFGDYLFDPNSKDQLKLKINQFFNSNFKTDVHDISRKVQERYSWQKTSSILFQLVHKFC